MTVIKKEMKCLSALIKYRLNHLMIYRTGFFGPFLVDASLFIIQLLVFDSIYGNVDRIGPWGRAEMIIFIGTFSLVNGVNMVVFFFGLYGIPEKIRSGELDLYITKPSSLLLRLSFEKFNPGTAPLVILSFFIIGYGISAGGFQVSLGRAISYGIFVLLMIVLWYDLMLMIRTVSFFTLSSDSIYLMEEVGLDLCTRIPGVVFEGVFKLVFYVILPYGIIATIPTGILTGEAGWQELLFGFVIVISFTIGAIKFWQLGVSHYNSASS